MGEAKRRAAAGMARGFGMTRDERVPVEIICAGKGAGAQRHLELSERPGLNPGARTLREVKNETFLHAYSLAQSLT